MRDRPSWRRRVAALVAITGLLVGGLAPLAQATAASSGPGSLLAAICSPNGVRYVEIDFSNTGADAPRVPLPEGLDHCPGCFGGAAPALLPVAVADIPAMVGDRVASASRQELRVYPSNCCFETRAQPFSS